MEVEGLAEMSGDPTANAVQPSEIEAALWKCLRNAAPRQMGALKELKAKPPNSAFIRCATGRKVKHNRIQCKLMESSGQAPKVAKGSISIRQASSDRERACARIYAYVRSWATTINGESAMEKFLLTQRQLSIAVKVARQRGKKKATLLVPKPLVKFTRPRGTRRDVLIGKGFARLCSEAVGTPAKDNNTLEGFCETEIGNTQREHDGLPEVRASIFILQRRRRRGGNREKKEA